MKKTISVLLSLCMILSMMFSVNVQAETSGDYWSYSDKVLTITGDVPNLTFAETPWQENRNDIRTILIKDAATTIGSGAFRDLLNLKNVVISSALESIGEEAFAGCSKLAAIEIPDSVASIGKDAFDAATAVCVGKDSVFANQTGYKTWTDGKENDTSLENTGKQSWAVYDNEILVISGSGSSNNSKVPWGAYHESITTIVLNYGLTMVNTSMFSKGKIPEGIATRESGYPNVTTYIMGDSITSIRPEELNGLDATKLTRWDTSSALTSIGHYITNSGAICAVKELFIPKDVKSYSTATGFFNMNHLESFIIEEGFNGFTEDIWTSEWDAFIKGFNVAELVIPNSVTKITNYTFNSGTVTKLVIKNKNTEIGDKAFNKCTISGVVCREGSKAEAWAKSKSIPVTYFDAEYTHAGTSWLMADQIQMAISGGNSSASVKAADHKVEGSMIIGEKATYSYTFNGGENYSKVIIAYKSGNAYTEIVETVAKSDMEFFVPSEAEGKNIYAFIFPMNIKGECGDAVIYDMGTAKAEFSSTMKIEIDPKEKLIDAIFEGTYGRNGSKFVLAVLCQLTDENELLESTPLTDEFESGIKNDITYTDIPLNTKADKVILYAWEGTSLTDTTMVSLADCKVVNVSDTTN